MFYVEGNVQQQFSIFSLDLESANLQLPPPGLASDTAATVLRTAMMLQSIISNQLLISGY